MENKKVLIVDDEEEARMYLANVIEELFPDLHIIFASTPNEAIYLVKKECIDAILLDVEMPGMSGLEMLSKLRDQQLIIPVIFVSAYKKAEFIQKAIRLDAVDYIDKPVNPIELNAALNKALSLTERLPIDFANDISHISNRIRLNTVKGVMFFDPYEILLFKSNKRDSLAVFKDGKSTLLIRENLSVLSNLLVSYGFIRVNRQHIVNSHCIKSVIKCDKTIILSVGEMKISPVFKDVLQNLTKKYDSFK